MNIDLEALLLQIVRSIAGRARELEERVEKMDEEYKDRITEIEAKELEMAPEQCEVGIEELKATFAMTVLHLEDTHKLLDDATSTWFVIEEILGLMIVHEDVQKN